MGAGDAAAATWPAIAWAMTNRCRRGALYALSLSCRRSTKPSKSSQVSLWGIDIDRFIAHDRPGNRCDHGICLQWTHQRLSFFHPSLDDGWTPRGRVRVRRDDMAQAAVQQNLCTAQGTTSELPGEALGSDLRQDSPLHQRIKLVRVGLHTEIALCMCNDRDHSAGQEVVAELLEIRRENCRRQLEQEVAPAIQRQHTTVFQPL